MEHIREKESPKERKKQLDEILQSCWNLSLVIEQNSHKIVKFMSIETGSRTPLSAAH